MRPQVVAVAFALLALGCTSPTEVLVAPEALQLVGRWQTVPGKVDVGGAGGDIQTASHQSTLTFAANGEVLTDDRTYGRFPGQRPIDVSSYFTNTGTFRVDGDSLTIHLTRSVFWDGLYGARAPVHLKTLPPGATYFHHAKFRIEGNQLIVDYASYALDAPVAATAVYLRAN